MKIWSALILLLFITCAIFVACEKEDTNVLSDDNIIKLFSSNGLSCKITKMEESRSENFPFCSIIKIVKIGEEEIFIFEYKNEKEVQHEITQDFSNEKGFIFYKKNVIFLYRGTDVKIINVLEKNLKS
jgi:hypothetical protein